VAALREVSVDVTGLKSEHAHPLGARENSTEGGKEVGARKLWKRTGGKERERRDHQDRELRGRKRGSLEKQKSQKNRTFSWFCGRSFSFINFKEEKKPLPAVVWERGGGKEEGGRPRFFNWCLSSKRTGDQLDG